MFAIYGVASAHRVAGKRDRILAVMNREIAPATTGDLGHTAVYAIDDDDDDDDDDGFY
eukprot:SAG31_NODE_1719_length_7455_cov_7.529772_15_plen_58_part_00